MKTNTLSILRFASVLLGSVLLLMACSKKNESINRELEKPSLISPKAHAEGVPIEDVELTWQKNMAPNGGEITFDVYFDDKENPSQMVASGLAANSFTLKDKLAIHIPLTSGK